MKLPEPLSNDTDERPDSGEAALEQAMAEAKVFFGTRSGRPLAALVFDSLVDGEDGPDAYRLIFEHPEVSIDARIEGRGDSTQITVEVTPPSAIPPILEFLSVEEPLVAQRHGERYRFSSVPHGVARLSLVRRDEGLVICTDWVRL